MLISPLMTKQPLGIHINSNEININKKIIENLKLFGEQVKVLKNRKKNYCNCNNYL